MPQVIAAQIASWRERADKYREYAQRATNDGDRAIYTKLVEECDGVIAVLTRAQARIAGGPT